MKRRIMKSAISVMLTLVLALSMTIIVDAEEFEKPIVSLEGLTTAEIDELTIEAMKNSMILENQRLDDLFAEDDEEFISSSADYSPTGRANYGIHVATRWSNGGNYREIQTQFVMGDRINAAGGAAVYFMHYLGGSSISIDSGIYYKNNEFRVFNFGSIKNSKDPSSNWDDSPLSNIYPGDTIYVNSEVTSTHIITTVKKNGSVIGSLKNRLRNTVTNPGLRIAREFNIASANPISNTDTYFNWSNAQSTLTTTDNKLVTMRKTNSKLKKAYYDIVEDGDHIGHGCESYSSGGFIYDKAWCRCNYK